MKMRKGLIALVLVVLVAGTIGVYTVIQQRQQAPPSIEEDYGYGDWLSDFEGLLSDLGSGENIDISTQGG